jgi:topoisomerase-4 subunit A
VSEKGRLLVFGREEMKQQAGGRGVVIMGLDEGESLAAVTVTLAQGITVQGVGRAGKVKDVKIPERDLGKYRLHRARKGCLLPEKIKPSAVS